MKRMQLLKIKVQVSSIWANGCMFDDCVCYLTYHDYPSLVEGESRGILFYFVPRHITEVRILLISSNLLG